MEEGSVPASSGSARTSTERPAARGRLRVYLGAAPGVGKTVAMLGEARRRRERGTDVVVGIVEDHGRDYTRECLGDLEVIPRRTLEHRGITLTELDLPAVLARRPAVVLIDELAHTNAPGIGHEKRWQDVQSILDAGIDVITTVNIQHLESLNDVVAGITGIVQAETVPDDVVRAADQIELVDMSPQSLRRRMAHGHVYPAGAIDTALGNYFREGNLTALRELALLWVADRVDEGLDRYRREHGITGTWAARERIVVALTGGPEGPLLLRRGARIAGRATGRDLVAVHIVRSDGSMGAPTGEIESQRLLAESLGGSFHLIVGDDIAASVLDFARGVNGTQIVVGASRHGRLTQLVRPSTSMAIVRGSGDIDVHVVTHQPMPRPPGRARRRASVRTRWAWAAVVGVPVLLAAVMRLFREGLNLPTVLLIFLLGVQTTALIGGVLPAAITAVVAGVLANLLFTQPYGSLTIAEPQNAFALLVFVVVGVTVASIVDRSRAAAAQAARGQAEAQLLAAVANTMALPGDPLTAVLEQARIGFGMRRAVLVRSGPGTTRPDPRVLAVAGDTMPDPDDPLAGADVVVDADGEEGLVLGLFGHPLVAADQQLVDVVAAQVALALERSELEAEAAQAERLRQSDVVRTAILAAVSHDLRTPLATIKASMSSLRDGAVTWSAEDRDDLLAATDEAADQLDGLLSNLLDLSRLQTGVLAPVRRPVSVDEVVYRALIGLPTARLDVEISDDLPLIDTDRGLLERVVANIVSNAVSHSADGKPVRILAGEVPGAASIQIRVIDHGAGVPEAQREAMFAPFQRLGDAPSGSGIGLGLAVARGLALAVDASIEVDDTPGGGLTMIITVPIAGRDEQPASGRSEGEAV
ncbi:sensor histidine kinase [Nakamurella panacisegetis]|uniref:sensor histidine kinase n=1 Tax=Nakamurella panacisegetis TaxID=1090615 RepID=UPI0038B25E90